MDLEIWIQSVEFKFWNWEFEFNSNLNSSCWIQILKLEIWIQSVEFKSLHAKCNIFDQPTIYVIYDWLSQHYIGYKSTKSILEGACKGIVFSL